MLRRLHRDERGIAALTVMLVTSVLAVTGGVVLVSSTTELEIGTRDRRAEEAFSASEAGLDLATTFLVKRPTFAQGQTQICLDNPLVPTDAAIACEVRITSPTNGQLFYPTTGRPYVEYTVMSRSKKGRSVVRTLVETFKLETADIPYGFFVDGDADFGGTTNIYRESMLVNGNVTSRDKVSFDLPQPPYVMGQHDEPDLGWKFHGHRIRSNPDPRLCSHPDGGMVGCAGVFSNFQIYDKNLLFVNREIHGQSTNPDHPQQSYPIDRDVHQTRFVNGQGQPVVTLPTNSILEMMDTLKQLSEQQVLYLNYKNGASQNIVLQPGDFNTTTRNFEQNVVVYIDADQGDTIKWQVSLVPNDRKHDGTTLQSNIKYLNDAGNRVGSLSGILVVRGGSLELEANTYWSGAVFVPENSFRLRGGTTCICTMYAKDFASSGGNSTVMLTPEWFMWLPSGFVRAVRTGFFECEPLQTYPAGSKCAGA